MTPPGQSIRVFITQNAASAVRLYFEPVGRLYWYLYWRFFPLFTVADFAARRLDSMKIPIEGTRVRAHQILTSEFQDLEEKRHTKEAEYSDLRAEHRHIISILKESHQATGTLQAQLRVFQDETKALSAQAEDLREANLKLTAVDTALMEENARLRSIADQAGLFVAEFPVELRVNRTAHPETAFLHSWSHSLADRAWMGGHEEQRFGGIPTMRKEIHRLIHKVRRLRIDIEILDAKVAELRELNTAAQGQVSEASKQNSTLEQEVAAARAVNEEVGTTVRELRRENGYLIESIAMWTSRNRQLRNLIENDG
jgi:chromosome segregation ATPase